MTSIPQREKERNFSRGTDLRRPRRCCCCSRTAPFPPGQPRPGRPRPLTASPFPRTTQLLLPCSQAATHRLRAPEHPCSHACMPACLPWGAEPAVTRADHPQVSNSERPGSPQFAQLVLPGGPHWDGAAAGAHSCKAGAHSQRCLQRLHPGVARLRLGFVPPVPGEWDVAILPFLRLRLGFVPPVPGEWDMPILPFLLQTPRRCLKCLWALAAEGRHGGTFRSPRR